MSISKTHISNLTDYEYVQRREARKAGLGRSTPSPLVAAYQTRFSRSLATHCKWLPSDSQYLTQSARSCGAFVAQFRSWARFLEEPDLGAFNEHPIVAVDRQLRWIDLPEECL